MINTSQIVSELSQNLSLPKSGIQAVLKLFSEDASIPFIARYRKELTGQINETDLRNIEDLQKQIVKREDRGEAVFSKLEELNVLTQELKQTLMRAKTLNEIEDIYQPFKSSRKTKAQ